MKNNIVPTIQNIDTNEIGKVNKMLANHILIPGSNGCKLVDRMNSIKDCIYFWSINTEEDYSEVVESIIDDSENHFKRSFFVGNEIKYEIIKNPGTTVSGVVHIINPAHGDIFDYFEVRSDMKTKEFIKEGDPVPEHLKEQVMEMMRKQLTDFEWF
jgi:hypothetical protein